MGELVNHFAPLCTGQLLAETRYNSLAVYVHTVV